MSRARSDAWRLAAGLAGVVLVTALYAAWLGVTNTATVAATLLLVVLLVAATSSLWVAVVTSGAAVLVFNFFFMAPVGTFTIADPHNWVALAVFLAVSLVASHLSSVARARTAEALQRRDELTRLFDLGRDVLVLTAGPEALSVLARAVARRFDLTFVAIAMPDGAEWRLHEAGTESLPLDRAELSRAMAAATTTLEFDAHTRTYAGQRAIRTPTGRDVRLVPLRVGTRPIGLLAAAGRPIEPGTLDALAGVVALAIERAQFLDERKTAALTRQSEELKTALLASLGHDLRTPLTAIRLAAANLKASWPTETERAEQSDVILSEVERLTRLFGNVLEMARIDAGAVSADAQWVHVSEIVAAARDQVEHALAGHPISLRVDEAAIVRVDPRLTATTLAHLLENAAQYSAPGSPIDVAGEAAEGTLTVQVRDRGPGVPPADLPRLFDRFYRGSASASRVSGTGMGLWIARELLAAERGRVWAENHPEGGAVFTLSVPAEVRVSAAAGSPTA